MNPSVKFSIKPVMPQRTTDVLSSAADVFSAMAETLRSLAAEFADTSTTTVVNVAVQEMAERIAKTHAVAGHGTWAGCEACGWQRSFSGGKNIDDWVEQLDRAHAAFVALTEWVES